MRSSSRSRTEVSIGSRPGGGSLMMDGPSSVRMEQTGGDPGEEPMPAPEDREPEASDPAEAALIGRLAFMPARVETPMPAPGPADPRRPSGRCTSSARARR